MAAKDIFLDTSVLIDFLRKQDKQKAVFTHLAKEHDLYISVITRFEIEVGLKSPQHRAEYQALLSRLEVLPVSESSIEQMVELHKYLKSNNWLVGFQDLIIGTTALHYRLPLATLNQKHFIRIPQLDLVDLSVSQS